MLILNDQEMVKSISYEELIESAESALRVYEKGGFYQPERMIIDHKKGTLLLMPCFAESVFGTKIISLFPENLKINFPVLRGLMILNNGETGEPLALLSGSKLTALRTAAVGSTSIRYLTPESVRSLGIVGAGVQGYHQALFANVVRKFKELHLFDLSRKRAENLSKRLSKEIPSVKIQISPDTEALVHKSDVIITATNSESPVIPDDFELLKEKHFVGIGSYKPFMKEYPPALFSVVEEVFIDTEHALKESGDLIDPLKNKLLSKDRIFTLGKIVTGQMDRNAFVSKTTFFKSVGMALFDIMAARSIYEKAREKGLGFEISLSED